MLYLLTIKMRMIKKIEKNMFTIASFLLVIFWIVLFFFFSSKSVKTISTDFWMTNYLIYEEHNLVERSDLLNILSILLAAYIIPKAIHRNQKKEDFTQKHLTSILNQFEDSFHDLNKLVFTEITINEKENIETTILLTSKRMGFILAQLEQANNRLGGDAKKIETFKNHYIKFLNVFGKLGESNFSFDQEFKSEFEISFWRFQSEVYRLKESISVS
ncbi:hypothetical protein BSK20_01815 [SR1 bacterium human oral taxon HOT-345]|nr:hypothetical protein BSK20_01815 [SR1 bacterium human oral taxon HOT-345]